MIVFTDPIVTVEAMITSIAAIYQPLIVKCNATILKGITNTVDIIWSTDNTQVRRVNNVSASSYINSSYIYNDSLIIPSLDINDIGNVYECEVLVNSVLPTSAKSDIIIPIPSMCMHYARTYVCTSRRLKLMLRNYLLHGSIKCIAIAPCVNLRSQYILNKCL